MQTGRLLAALCVGVIITQAEVTEGPWLINRSPVKKDGLRITTLGSGTPDVRKDQVSSGFLIELGNGDKFIWDLGTGSYQNLLATATPASEITKVKCHCLHRFSALISQPRHTYTQGVTVQRHPMLPFRSHSALCWHTAE